MGNCLSHIMDQNNPDCYNLLKFNENNEVGIDVSCSSYNTCLMTFKNELQMAFIKKNSIRKC